jgi:hypothetical protein
MINQISIFLFSCFTEFVSGLWETKKEIQEALSFTSNKVKLCVSVIFIVVGLVMWLSYVWRDLIRLISHYLFLGLSLILMATGSFYIIQTLLEQLNSVLPSVLITIKGSASTALQSIIPYLLVLLVGMLLQCWGTFHAWLITRYKGNKRFQENRHTNQHNKKTNQLATVTGCAVPKETKDDKKDEQDATPFGSEKTILIREGDQMLFKAKLPRGLWKQISQAILKNQPLSSAGTTDKHSTFQKSKEKRNRKNKCESIPQKPQIGNKYQTKTVQKERNQPNKWFQNGSGVYVTPIIENPSILENMKTNPRICEAQLFQTLPEKSKGFQTAKPYSSFIPEETFNSFRTLNDLRNYLWKISPRERIFYQEGDIPIPALLKTKTITAVTRWIKEWREQVWAKHMKSRGVDLYRCQNCNLTVKKGHECLKTTTGKIKYEKGLPMRTTIQVSAQNGRLATKKRKEVDIDLATKNYQDIQKQRTFFTNKDVEDKTKGLIIEKKPTTWKENLKNQVNLGKEDHEMLVEMANNVILGKEAKEDTSCTKKNTSSIFINRKNVKEDTSCTREDTSSQFVKKRKPALKTRGRKLVIVELPEGLDLKEMANLINNTIDLQQKVQVVTPDNPKD